MGDNDFIKDIQNRVWKIRDLIQELEDIKDQIIEYLTSNNGSDEGAHNVWVTDAKEFYYNTVAAWEMLRSVSDGKKKLLENSKEFLSSAKSRLSQSISELKTFKEEKASKLEEKALNTFEKCWNAFNYEFNLLTEKKKFKKPIETVIMRSDIEYQLPCSVCSKTSVEFKVGIGRFDKSKSLLFRGITHGTSLNLKLTEKLFPLLEKKNLLGVHKFMKNYHGYEGLDAYCPKCDLIYCWEHYNAEEEFDDGFYDCTYGTCPESHKRMIDD